jgi:four helix bundle protein
MEDFSKLRVWNSAKEFFVDVYHTTRRFPAEERYGFTSQMRRASRSICGNIAEGCGYSGDRDSVHFNQMAFGSSSECYSDLHLTREVELITPADFDRLEGKLTSTRKQLARYIQSMERRIAQRGKRSR